MKKIHITPGVIKRFKQFLTGKYIEDGATASQNIPAGKWIIWKGQACYAKTAITQGDTLSSSNLDTDDEGMMNQYQYAKFENVSSANVSATSIVAGNIGANKNIVELTGVLDFTFGNTRTILPNCNRLAIYYRSANGDIVSEQSWTNNTITGATLYIKYREA